MSDDLKLPIIKEDMPPDPVLSMDAYLEFVEFGWLHLTDRQAVEEQEKRERVDVPFRLIN
jgi:hypothetical protein